MNGQSEAPDGDQAHGQFLEVSDTFKSLGVDPVGKQNAIGDQEHQSPKNINDRDILQHKVAKGKESATEKEHAGVQLLPIPSHPEQVILHSLVESMHLFHLNLF